MCICVFAHLCGTVCQQNHRKKTNTQKTPSDGNCSTMLICVFVYLCIHQQNHSLTQGQNYITGKKFTLPKMTEINYYSLQYNWFQDFVGAGRYLDIRLCSIPTVGVYKKQGKLHLTRSTSYLLYYSSPKHAPSPLLLDGLLYSW